MTFDLAKIFEDEVMSKFVTVPFSAYDGKKVTEGRMTCANLKSVGFNGPIMIEGVKVGATAEETTANARANREFLENVTASV